MIPKNDNMLDLYILKFGLILHIVVQLFYGSKTKNFKPSKRILLSSVLIFSLIGTVLTIMNLYSNVDFGESGTKRFNPLIIIVIWGSMLNLVVYIFSYVILLLTKMIERNIKKNTSM